MRKKVAALKYDPGKAAAPRIVAKGKGKIAERILAAAKEYGIDIKEDPDLAEALSLLDLNDEIPENLYKAVAEILAELYRINKKMF